MMKSESLFKGEFNTKLDINDNIIKDDNHIKSDNILNDVNNNKRSRSTLKSTNSKSDSNDSHVMTDDNSTDSHKNSEERSQTTIEKEVNLYRKKYPEALLVDYSFDIRLTKACMHIPNLYNFYIAFMLNH